MISTAQRAKIRRAWPYPAPEDFCDADANACKTINELLNALDRAEAVIRDVSYDLFLIDDYYEKSDMLTRIGKNIDALQTYLTCDGDE